MKIPMYIPKSFAESDAETLYAFIRDHNFGTLVTQQAGELSATPLPFLIDSERGVLQGHMARANPHWKTFAHTGQALVIFQGPHAYISPTWYIDQPSVPTWNYSTVQIYGTPRLISDEAAIHDMLAALVSHHEQGRDPEWEMTLPADYLRTMLQAIVAFEITIERIDGKFKLSQNRADADQQNVIEHLAHSVSATEQDTARLMAARRGN